jgi:hypothetical protein
MGRCGPSGSSFYSHIPRELRLSEYYAGADRALTHHANRIASTSLASSFLCRLQYAFESVRIASDSDSRVILTATLDYSTLARNQPCSFSS